MQRTGVLARPRATRVDSGTSRLSSPKNSPGPSSIVRRGASTTTVPSSSTNMPAPGSSARANTCPAGHSSSVEAARIRSRTPSSRSAKIGSCRRRARRWSALTAPSYHDLRGPLANGVPALPRDAEDDERDDESDDRVGKGSAESDDARAEQHAEADEAVDAS